MRVYAILVTACLCASVFIKYAQAGYHRLNEYLVANVDTDDIEPNIEAAKAWLDRKGQSLVSVAPTSDLKKFIALEQVINEPKCDRTDYAILFENEDEVGLYYSFLYDKVKRRVEKVIVSSIKIHAEKCHKVYIDRYYNKQKLLDSVLAKRVATFTKTLLEKNRFSIPAEVFYQPEHLLHGYVLHHSSVRYCLGEQHLNAAILSVARDNPSIECFKKIPTEPRCRDDTQVQADEVKHLIKDYLIVPCRFYLDEFGPDLYVPASFDVRYFYEIDKSKPDFYMGWVSFLICREIVDNEGIVHLNAARSITAD